MYLFLTSFILLLPSASALWPIPVSYDHGDTVLFLRKDVQFHCYEPRKRNVGSIADQSSSRFTFASNSNTQVNSQDPLQLRKRFDETELETSTIKYATYENTSEGGSVTSDEIISYAIKSARKAIFSQNIYPWKFHPRNWSEPVQNSDTKYISTISIHILKPNSSNVADPLASPIDESYTLTIDTSGTTTISANTSLGIKHGLTTLTQLFYATANKENIYTPLAPLTIHDRPKFSHRGLNLDVARNWYPTSVIKRQIAAASYNKLNVLHLHITDSQSWPLEIPSLPDLSRKGAYRPDLVYTPSDFLNLQHYAALHGMQLITEIDMPGHTSSIHHAYPDLIAAFNIQPNWDTYAAEPPSGTLKLNSTPVTKFLDTLFADLLPRVKPYTAYFHTGGDEVNKNAYTLDDTVESNDSAILQPLMQKFVDRNHANVRNAGLTPIVWEEMLLDWNLTLGKDVVVQSWQSDAAVLNIVSKGYKALAGNYNFWVCFIVDLFMFNVLFCLKAYPFTFLFPPIHFDSLSLYISNRREGWVD